jgi:hypothetical protein
MVGILPEAVRTRRGKAGVIEPYLEGLRTSKEWISLLTDRPRIAQREFVDSDAWKHAVELAQFGYLPLNTTLPFVSAVQLEIWLRQAERCHDRFWQEKPQLRSLD